VVNFSITATAIPENSTLALSTLGTLDWVHWGLTDVASVNRKSGATTIIGDLQPIIESVKQHTTAPTTWPLITWSGGTPTASSAGTRNQITSVTIGSAVGSGFRFSAAGAATTRVLHLYLGVYKASSTLTVSHLGGQASVDLAQLDSRGFWDVAIPFTGTGTLVADWLKTGGTERLFVIGAAVE
jgi:hypothetical protein